MDKVLVFLPIECVVFMHIKIFSGVIYLLNHRGSKLVALLDGFILIFQRTEFSFIPFAENGVSFRSSTGTTTTTFTFCFYSCTFAFVVQAFIHND